MPSLNSASAVLSAVCPPIVGSSASGRSFSMILATISGRDRLDIGRVGKLRVGHDRRRVRIDDDDPIALGLQRLDRLAPRIIELRRLADDDRPGADDQDRGDVGALGHCGIGSSGELHVDEHGLRSFCAPTGRRRARCAVAGATRIRSSSRFSSRPASARRAPARSAIATSLSCASVCTAPSHGSRAQSGRRAATHHRCRELTHAAGSRPTGAVTCSVSADASDHRARLALSHAMAVAGSIRRTMPVLDLAEGDWRIEYGGTPPSHAADPAMLDRCERDSPER